jgi:hypothetical protein
MIANAREYQITKEEAERFAQALAAADAPGSGRDPEMHRLLSAALESQLRDLHELMTAYEARTGCGG